jgi:glycosyltransferase involved in cell wall biosynthesis
MPLRPVDRPRDNSGVPMVLHVIPTAVARGAQREARALRARLDVPGVRHHRLLSLFAAETQVPVDYALEHPGGNTVAQGFSARLALRLRGALQRIGPSVVVAHGGDPLKYLVPATLGRRIPLAYYATGTFGRGDRRLPPWSAGLWRALTQRADVVACEGAEVLEECRLRFGVPDSRLVLAPNGRDPAQFHPRPEGPRGPEADRVADPAEDPPVAVFVGALAPGKRPGRFIEVVAELRRRGVPLRAVVCGDGELSSALAPSAAQADVALLGSRGDVADILRRCDVFVFPSLPTGEGMPGVLIEAGLSGLPVVATDVPGVRSIVEDTKTGFVVDPDDRAAMVDATAALLTDRALCSQMGSAARARCVEHFSIDAVAACWLSFLTPLVARAGAPHERDRRRRHRRPGAPPRGAAR